MCSKFATISPRYSGDRRYLRALFCFFVLGEYKQYMFRFWAFDIFWFKISILLEFILVDSFYAKGHSYLAFHGP